jgi:hypothetical protein
MVNSYWLQILSPKEVEILYNHYGSGEEPFAMWFAMYTAKEAAKKYYADLDGDKNLVNDPGDAYRHAYWGALLTDIYGEIFARDFSKVDKRRFYRVYRTICQLLHKQNKNKKRTNELYAFEINLPMFIMLKNLRPWMGKMTTLENNSVCYFEHNLERNIIVPYQNSGHSCFPEEY